MEYKNYIFCLAGKSELAVYGLNLCIKYLDKNKIRIIYNEKDDPEPGIDTWQPSLLKAAKEKDIKIISIEEFYKLDNIIFLSLEFYKIIDTKKFLNSNLYNIHFSNLPSYRGMYTSALPIINNEKESGVTLHEIDSGIDSGNIIDQIIFKINYNNTARDLYFKYIFYAKNLLKNNFEKIIRKEIISFPQPKEGSSYYSSKSIDYNDIRIELLAKAEEIRNQIRAYYFPEYQVAKIHNYFIKSAFIKSTKSSKPAGSILKITKSDITISTLNYDLILKREKTYEFIESIKNNNHKEVLEYINCGCDLNKRYGCNGYTPLITASINYSDEVISILIDNGAEVNKPCYLGITPLMYAMFQYPKRGKRFIFDLLIKKGANFKLKDINKKTIFDYALEKNIYDLF